MNFILFQLLIHFINSLSFGENPNQYKDAQNDTIMLTCVLNPGERYVFSEQLSQSSNFIENYENNDSCDHYDIKNFNDFIFSQIKVNVKQEEKVIRTLIDVYSQRIDLIIIYQIQGSVNIKIEIRKFQIEQVKSIIASEGINQYKLQLLENKNKSIFFYPQTPDEKDKYIFLKASTNFFQGQLIALIKISSSGLEWKLKFHYHKNGLQGFFSYSPIDLEQFSNIINRNLEGQNFRKKLFKDLQIDQFFMKIIPIRRHELDYEFKEVFLILKLERSVWLYRVNKDQDYYPQLLNQITETLDKKQMENQLEDILKEIFEHSQYGFCEIGMETFLYKSLAQLNFITQKELDDLLDKQNIFSNFQINCMQTTRNIFIYKYDQIGKTNDFFITKQVLNYPQLSQKITIQYFLQNAQTCHKHIFIETQNFFSFICFKYSDQMLVYKIFKNGQIYAKKLKLEFQITFNISHSYQVDFSGDTIIFYSELQILVIYFNQKFMLINNRAELKKDEYMFFQINEKNIQEQILEEIQIEKTKINNNFQDQGISQLQKFLRVYNYYYHDENENGIELINLENQRKSKQKQISTSRQLIIFQLKNIHLKWNEIIYLKYVQNLYISFESKNFLNTQAFIKGNFLNNEFEYENIKLKFDVDSNEQQGNKKQTLEILEIQREFNFYFDELKYIYPFVSFPDDKLLNYQNLNHLNISLILSNKENLFYVKKTIQDYYFNDFKQNQQTENKEIFQKAQVNQDQILFPLQNLKQLFYCQQNRKTILKNGLIFKCLEKKQDYQIEYYYYFYSFESTTVKKLEDLQGCSKIIYVSEYDLIFCKTQFSYKLFYFQQKNFLLQQLNFNLDNDLDYATLQNYDQYSSQFASKNIILYKLESNPIVDNSLIKADKKQQYLNLIVLRFFYMKKFELKILQKISISVETNFRLLYFFYEQNRFIIISPNQIKVYFWTKTLTYNPLLIKKTYMSMFQSIDAKISKFKNFTPKVLFYQNEIVQSQLYGTDFHNYILTLPFTHIIGNQIQHALIFYNFLSPKAEEFQKYIPLKNYKIERFFFNTFDIFSPHILKKKIYYSRGIVIMEKIEKDDNKKDNYNQYKVKLYIPCKKFLVLDFDNQLNKKIKVNVDIKQVNYFNKKQKQKSLKQNFYISNNMKLLNKIQLTKSNYRLYLIETQQKLTGIKLYNFSIQYFFNGNIMSNKFQFDFNTDQFSNIINFSLALKGIEEFQFSKHQQNFYKDSKHEIKVTVLPQNEFLIMNQKVAFVMKKNVILKSYPLDPYLVFPHSYFEGNSIQFCKIQLYNYSDLLIYNCKINNEFKNFVYCLGRLIDCFGNRTLEISYVNKKHTSLEHQIAQQTQISDLLYTQYHFYQSMKLMLEYNNTENIIMKRFEKQQINSQMILPIVIHYKQEQKGYTGWLQQNKPFYTDNNIMTLHMTFQHTKVINEVDDRSDNKNYYENKTVNFKQKNNESIHIQRNTQYITSYMTVEDINLIKLTMIVNNETKNQNKAQSYGSSFLIENQQFFQSVIENEKDIKIYTSLCNQIPSNFKDEKKNKDSKIQEQDNQSFFVIVQIPQQFIYVFKINYELIYKYNMDIIPQINIKIFALSNHFHMSRTLYQNFFKITNFCFLIIGQNNNRESLISVFDLNIERLHWTDKRLLNVLNLQDFNKYLIDSSHPLDFAFFPYYQKNFKDQKIIQVNVQTKQMKNAEYPKNYYMIIVQIICNLAFYEIKLSSQQYLQIKNQEFRSSNLIIFAENDFQSNQFALDLKPYLYKQNQIKEQKNLKNLFILMGVLLIGSILSAIFNKQFKIINYQ